MYRVEITDPVTGNSLTRLVDMPWVIEDVDKDSLIIYLESGRTRDLYLQDPTRHRLQHYGHLPEN
jgi:hypothetical protein